jgi:hypothetical protein
VFDPRFVYVRYVVEKVAMGQVFFSNYFGFSCEYHSNSSPHTSSPTCCSAQKDKGTNPENLPKSNAVSKIEELLIQEYFRFFFFSLQNIHENFRVDAPGLYIALEGSQ